MTNEQRIDDACDAWESSIGDKLPDGLREGLKEIGDLIGEGCLGPGDIAFARMVWTLALFRPGQDINRLSVRCEKHGHDKRAVNPFVHPTEKEKDGSPFLVHGAPPQTDDEPAWCKWCGALWRDRGPGLLGILGKGYAWIYPGTDEAAPTLGNLVRDESKKRKAEDDGDKRS